MILIVTSISCTTTLNLLKAYNGLMGIHWNPKVCRGQHGFRPCSSGSINSGDTPIKKKRSFHGFRHLK